MAGAGWQQRLENQRIRLGWDSIQRISASQALILVFLLLALMLHLWELIKPNQDKCPGRHGLITD
jgi:hypothetical protein